MRIVVSGASGFIGSRLMESFSYHEVLALSRTRIQANCKVLYGDLNEIESLLDDYDAFIHAAGQAHIKQSSETVDLFIKNNVKATNRALELALKANVRHFILISSIATKEVVDTYGKTKYESELAVKNFCESNNMQYTIIRPVMVYGENDRKGNMAKLVRGINKGVFPLFNSGKTIKNMIYIDNLVFIINSILQNKDYYSRCLEVRDKETLDLKEICMEIRRSLEKRAILLPIPRAVSILAVHIIGIVQRLGLLRSLNKNSISKLLTDVNIPFEPFDLPFTSHEGIRRTVKGLIK